MRGVMAIAAALIVACSAPVPNAAPAAAQQPAPITTPTLAAPSDASSDTGPIAQPRATDAASPVPSPAAPTPAPGPVSAGVVPEAGVLFFPDYDGGFFGRPDYGRAFPAALYRYDGASGSIAKLEWRGFVAHETVGGVYLRGPQGRWDLLRWDGTFSSDRSFTACQVEPGIFASWCTVSATGVGVGWGSHTGPACAAPRAFIRLPGEAQARQLLPAEFCVVGVEVSADGTQLLIVRFVPDGSAGGIIPRVCEAIGGPCYRFELWVMPVGGSPRRLRLSPELPGFAANLALSPDGRSATAEHLGGLFLIDVSTGRTTYLGSVYPGQGWRQWSANGRLAFVRGGGRESWFDKTIVVREPDGSTREPPGLPVVSPDPYSAWIGLAPAWDPGGKRLAWIASRPKGGDPQGYLDGRGVGDRHVLVSDLISDPLEIRCGEGVAEGVRWSHDGTALLLLCRRSGARANAFELWLHRLNVPGGASVPVVRGLTWGGVDEAHGLAPSLFTHTAWSRALATPPR